MLTTGAALSTLPARQCAPFVFKRLLYATKPREAILLLHCTMSPEAETYLPFSHIEVVLSNNIHWLVFITRGFYQSWTV